MDFKGLIQRAEKCEYVSPNVLKKLKAAYEASITNDNQLQDYELAYRTEETINVKDATKTINDLFESFKKVKQLKKPVDASLEAVKEAAEAEQA